MPRIIFITGTDTGVGKTVVTALLVHCARVSGIDAVGLKPFSTGDRSDAKILAAVSGVPLDAINPWHFPSPVSPWTAARKKGVRVKKQEVLKFVRQQRHELVLVEGAGGVLSPLGEGFNSLDLIRQLDCEVILVAANRLGVLSHALLSLQALQPASVKVAFIEAPAAAFKKDPSIKTNLDDLRELAGPVQIVSVPWLSGLSTSGASVKRNAKASADAVGALLR